MEYVAAVGMPDADLGEKVCAFVKSIGGARITYEDIVLQMKQSGVAKALIPA
ncbi:MAG: hypothetical protein HY881_14960 [Deltaproteobacteria bacterium]|nr:hypothetical protein [Deltaproteobacteria bacterium]